MDPKNVESNLNNTNSNTSISQSSLNETPSSGNRTSNSSSNTKTNPTFQRSARLSNKHPKSTSLQRKGSILHQTLSGGIENSHSPKLNVRKRILENDNANETSANLFTYSTTTSSDNVGININNNNNNNDDDDDGNVGNDDGNNNNKNNNGNSNNNLYQSLLPSDQSDDDEILPRNNASLKQKSMGLLTRAEVLAYFSVEPNGYKCNLCNKVCIYLDLIYIFDILI